ncbi:hypothetical protein KGM_209926 [Danaus plexippus plexippus]|uniref:Uncharacterized protein n=1 Tax=Danaus plexippus plexippus TaxID=278856 RepID=A0A212FB21_DANPL|nr:hypothetical protein KGM_209926 [Danaus plexippus plexippus]
MEVLLSGFIAPVLFGSVATRCARVTVELLVFVWSARRARRVEARALSRL